MFWVLKITLSLRRFFWAPTLIETVLLSIQQHMFWLRNMKINYNIFLFLTMHSCPEAGRYWSRLAAGVTHKWEDAFSRDADYIVSYLNWRQTTCLFIWHQLLVACLHISDTCHVARKPANVLPGPFLPISRGRISAPFPIKNSHLFSQYHVWFSQLRIVTKKRKKKKNFFFFFFFFTFFFKTTTTYEQHRPISEWYLNTCA